MAGYFDQLFGGSPAMMGSPNPSAFTSPGMSPQALAMLMHMQNGQQQQPNPLAPGAGMMPTGPQLPPMQPRPAGGPQAPQLPGGAIQGQNMLQQILPMLSQGGGGLGGLLGGLGGGGAAGAPGSAAGLGDWSARPNAGILGLLGSLFGGGGR